MTNAQIIFNASVELMKDGTIKGTGRIFEMQDESGETIRLEEPEALHTYSAWKELGRQVKRGEKCKARIDIWKHGKARTVKNDAGEDEEKPGRMFLKKAFFFTLDQTEPVKA